VLESVFLALFGFAIFILALTAWDRDEVIWPVVGFITWLALAVYSTSIETLHAFLATDNTVVTHISSYTGTFPLTFLFGGIAFILLIIAWQRAFGMVKQREVG